ncbi:MAG: helix-turn-helix transcriptional regulator [Betaproteobacteria bacterium]|nr:helix-turn-helix transcriptional regulator [Betaproteobacteria bacterium]
MPHSAALLEALKRELRVRRITYARVARHLGLSLTSVKRLFSRNGFNLQRIDRICALMDIEFTDLAHVAVARTSVISQLSFEQEKEFVDDPRLMLVACAALSYWNLEQIVEHYDFTPAQCIRLLVKLDRLKFIELGANNRFRLRVSQTFSWLPDGPIQQQFRKYMQLDYFRSRFNSENELMLQVFGALSKPSRAALLTRLKRLAHEFSEMNRQDGPLPLGERQSMTLLLAVRPWEPLHLRALRRKRPETRQADRSGAASPPHRIAAAPGTRT